MKRISLLLTAGVLVFSLTACGNRNTNDANNATENSGVIENSDVLDNTNDVNNGVLDNGTNTDGTLDNEVNNEGVVDNVAHEWSEEMTSFRDAVKEALGENYYPEMAVTPDMLPDQFGLTEDMYEDYIAEMPMISVNPDTLLIVKAKDGKVKEVEAALNAWRDAKIEDGHMYPASAPKYNGSKIETIGNYVILAMLGGDNMTAMEEGDEAAIKHSQEHNEKAIEAIRKLIEK